MKVSGGVRGGVYPTVAVKHGVVGPPHAVLRVGRQETENRLSCVLIYCKLRLWALSE